MVSGCRPRLPFLPFSYPPGKVAYACVGQIGPNATDLRVCHLLDSNPNGVGRKYLFQDNRREVLRERRSTRIAVREETNTQARIPAIR
jgi:hypothetical protein